MNFCILARSTFRMVGSLLLGACIGVLLHYTLYRIGLPLEPFIYMNF